MGQWSAFLLKELCLAHVSEHLMASDLAVLLGLHLERGMVA